MGGIDYKAIEDAGGISKYGRGEKGKPRFALKESRRREKERSIEHAYDEVDARDNLVSVVSGRKLSKRGGPETKIFRHHMARRSQAPGRVGDIENIISVSAVEAECLDLHKLIPVNANGEEVFNFSEIAGFAWNREYVKPGTEPRRWKPLKVLELRGR